jgi:hypothetical protein
MRKVTNTHYVNIVNITLATFKQYLHFCLYCAHGAMHSDAAINAQMHNDDLQMHKDDVTYITDALTAFVSSKNAVALHSALMQQDTFVREYFINTLRYIEENNLTTYMCCV